MSNLSSQGCLYLVATPIGNLDDITFRAIETLKTVDWIGCEDTRRTRQLLSHYGIQARLVSLHRHNERVREQEMIQNILSGESVAVVSDAGLPVIQDPGASLVAAAHSNGIRVVPIPGACALTTALIASGLSAEHFVFEGFLPRSAGDRRRHLEGLLSETRTLIFYEAPHRLMASLESFLAVFGAQRRVCVARELTKVYETIMSGPLGDIVQRCQDDPNQQKGEFVLLVEGCEASAKSASHVVVSGKEALQILLAALPLKQAVSMAAQMTGESRNQLYQCALEIQQSMT